MLQEKVTEADVYCTGLIRKGLAIAGLFCAAAGGYGFCSKNYVLAAGALLPLSVCHVGRKILQDDLNARLAEMRLIRH